MIHPGYLLVLEQSEVFAKSLLDRGDMEDSKRIAIAFLNAYGRPPTEGEQTKAETFLKRMEEVWAEGDRIDEPSDDTYDPAELYAWKNYCHVIMASSEFIYIN